MRANLIIKAVAASLAFLAFSMQSFAEGDLAQGKIKSQMCIGCHNIPGYKTAFPIVYRVPRIQGQSAEYIKYALMEYASGTRYSEELNRLASMPSIAASLTEKDIDDLATYYSSLGE